MLGASVYPLVVNCVEPLMIGFAPLPYAPNVIGDPLDPLDGAVSAVPYHASPRLKRIESPAENVDPLILPIVCQGCAESVPLLESLPAAASSRSSREQEAQPREKRTERKSLRRHP